MTTISIFFASILKRADESKALRLSVMLYFGGIVYVCISWFVKRLRSKIKEVV